MRVFRYAAAVLSAAFMITTAAKAESTITQSGFTPLYLGVDIETARVDGNHADIVRVDLHAPGLHFKTTSAGGTLNTISAPLSQFVTDHDLQLAVNANFFSPCCSSSVSPESLIGLAVDRGHVVSQPSYSAGNGNVVLVLDRENHAEIKTLKSANDLDLDNIYNAVAGDMLVVRNGVNVAPTDNAAGSFDGPNPRTAAGLSFNQRYLYFVTIDGRISGYSSGASLAETGDLMVAVGAWNALNLDGGASTEMVTRKTAHSDPFIVNNPSGGTERMGASAIGFRALPLPKHPQALTWESMFGGRFWSDRSGVPGSLEKVRAYLSAKAYQDFADTH